MLIVQPIGGLCNRIRSVNSAYALAQARNDTLTILWFCNEELNCPFEQIFKLPQNVSIFNIHSKWNLRKLYYQLTTQMLTNKEITPHKLSLDKKADFSSANERFFSSLKKRCYIATEESFYPTKDYSLFKPTLELQEKIHLLVQNFADFTYGVHIRRTDNLPAKDGSSTSAFITAMYAKMAIDECTYFYLATDDLEEEKTIRNLFPGRIISNQNHSLSRNTIEGIQDAVIDLFCLASTKSMIGSYCSSFTDIAADIGNIPKEIAKSAKTETIC